MDRVFLDANILFSAAYRNNSGLLRIWNLERTSLITSAYAKQEAIPNLESKEQQERLVNLLRSVEVQPNTAAAPLPPEIHLPEKDRPILQAAIEARATHLLTGDIRHFGELFGKKINQVLVLLPAEYLKYADSKKKT